MHYTQSVIGVFCPVPTVNSNMETHTTFKLGGKVTRVSTNCQTSFEVQRSRLLGAVIRKPFSAHIFTKKLIDSHKDDPILCCTFYPVQCGCKIACFLREPGTNIPTEA